MVHEPSLRNLSPLPGMTSPVWDTCCELFQTGVWGSYGGLSGGSSCAFRAGENTEYVPSLYPPFYFVNVLSKPRAVTGRKLGMVDTLCTTFPYDPCGLAEPVLTTRSSAAGACCTAGDERSLAVSGMSLNRRGSAAEL